MVHFNEEVTNTAPAWLEYAWFKGPYASHKQLRVASAGYGYTWGHRSSKTVMI